MGQEWSGRFEGKVALVTGAASGLGRSIALRLNSEGAYVFAHDLNEAGLARTLELSEVPNRMHIRAGDVSSRRECFDAVEQAVGLGGQLDILGNVAGIARGDHFPGVTEDAYRRMMSVNVDGYFFMAQAGIEHLVASAGSLISIASFAGLRGQAYTVVYCMSKGAVIQMTRALAMEYAKSGVRINAIAPGAVETELLDGYQFAPDPDMDLVSRYAPNFRAPGKPEDISSLFAFMASEEGRNLHGAVMSSDGGLLAG